MRITEISFCDKVGYNIRSDETKTHILERIQNDYNIKIVSKHFEKYDDARTPDILNNNPHLACLRSNGNPYFLLLTRHNYNDIAVFIDKKVQQGYFLPRMIVSHIMLGDGEKDTLFDGEMVKTNKGKWMYLINDIHVYKGQHLTNMNLVKRINLVYDILEKDYVYNEMAPFDIAVKRYFNYAELKSDLDAHIASLPYTCRGVYFKPLFLKFRDILVNFDDSLVKKVKREKMGGTFMMRQDSNNNTNTNNTTRATAAIVTLNEKEEVAGHRIIPTRKTASPDVYELIDAEGKVMGIACIQTMKVSKAMRGLFLDKNLVDRVEIKYVYNEEFKKWVPVIV